MTKSKIEWTDETWNPLRGCSRKSPGCLNCYAERQAIRQAGHGKPYEGLVQITNGHPQWTGVVEFDEERLMEPFTWRKPRMVFVNSMSDLFHEEVRDEWIDKIFAVMAMTPQHTYQILTKRPERMVQYFLGYKFLDVRGAFIGKWIGQWHQERTGEPVVEWSGLPMPNVWHGFSAENQKYFDERWESVGPLSNVGFNTFVSAEPLLGEIRMGPGRRPDWVIAGGESGPGARPANSDWFRTLRDDCAAGGVPFFFKQWGAWIPVMGQKHGAKIHQHFEFPDGEVVGRVGKREAGAELDGRTWREYPTAK